MAMPSLVAGDLLAGRFEILEPVGAGGLAEVYSARDRTAGGTVAVKVLHRHLAGAPALAERFRHEMLITRKLDSPHIVRVFEAYEHEGRPLFSMELLQGETLAERLRAEGKLPAGEARRIAREICAGLEVAHAAGVVHRDLKPANVFLTAEGVKLLDFGQARAAGLTQLAAKSAMMGTPGYLAPELLAGQRGDARSDLYAVGAILFELLAGRRAYDSDDPFRVAQLQAAGAASPRSIDNSITESDDATVRRALDPDPERRFASAGQLGLALGGGLVPAAPVVPPGLTRGGNDVWVSDPFESIFEGESKAMRGFLALFGARKSALAGLNDLQAVLLVSGASSEAAEEVARLAAAHGLVATVRPTAGGWLRSLARTHPLATPLLAFGMAGPGIAALLFTGMDWFVRRLEVAFPVHRVVARSGLWDDLLQGKPPLVIMACLLVCACGLLPWALLPSLHAPAVEHLAEGDPVVVRLLEGIRRRVAALLQRANTSGAAGEALAGLVQQIAQEAEAVARTLAVEAPAAEATTLPAGFPAQEEHRGDHRDDHRDAGIARLLHAAASLDAALADTAATGGDGLSRAVAQLRGEVEFVRAQAALPGPSTPPGSGS